MAYTTINKSTDHFNTKLFTANASTQSITGVGFQPDMVWGKSRGQSYDHEIYDAVRGVYKRIKTNQNHAEVSDNANLTSFDSDGFSLGSATNMNYSNGDNICSWNWKANGAGSSNSDGSITSTVSANTTAGFSICTFTAEASGSGNYGHGLGVAPSLILQKSITTTADWFVYHKSLGANDYVQLNSTGAKSTNSVVWSGTAPSSTVVNLGSGWTNSSHGNVVAYCFAEKKGFSKFGSYTGNGSADGTFVYTGFKPAFLLYKCSSDNFTNWQIHDSARSPSNLSVNRLNPNDASVELSTTSDSFDLLSNGFKARGTASNSNNSGSSFIYMAFAEAPLVGSNNVPCTAR